jgi:hypothetical protein
MSESNKDTEQSVETAPIRTRKRTSVHPSAKTKKGIKAWIRGDLIRLENRDDGWEYRWCNKNDAVKMAQREAQGFVKVTSTSGLHAENAGKADIKHSGPSTKGIVEMGDLVLMALPEDAAEERRQAVMEINKEALEGMTEEVDANFEKLGATRHGKISIEVS